MAHEDGTPGASAPGDAGAALTLSIEERDLVEAELEALLPALEGERRVRYEALADAVADGEVPAALTPALAALVELALQTARARHLYHAEGERVLDDLLRRTPRGQELAEQVAAVNQALAAVTGTTLRSVGVRLRTVGHVAVTFRTDGATVTLAVRPDSVSVESVDVHAA